MERLPDHLVHEVISKDLHDRAVHRGLGQREHLLEAFIDQANLQVAIRDQNALHHAGQDHPETEIFIRDLLRVFSLSPRDLFQVAVNFLHNPRTRNLTRKRSVHPQTPDFAPEKQHPAPQNDDGEEEAAAQNQPDNEPPRSSHAMIDEKFVPLTSHRDDSIGSRT